MTNAERLAALRLVHRMHQEALPKFNWGASCLDAEAITLLNTAPAALLDVIRSLEAE